MYKKYIWLPNCFVQNKFFLFIKEPNSKTQNTIQKKKKMNEMMNERAQKHRLSWASDIYHADINKLL